MKFGISLTGSSDSGTFIIEGPSELSDADVYTLAEALKTLPSIQSALVAPVVVMGAYKYTTENISAP